MQILHKCRSSCSEIGSAHDLYSCFLCCGRLGSEFSSASLDGSEFASVFWALKYTAHRIEKNNEMMHTLVLGGICWHLLPRTREARKCSPLSSSLITLLAWATHCGRWRSMKLPQPNGQRRAPWRIMEKRISQRLAASYKNSKAITMTNLHFIKGGSQD